MHLGKVNHANSNNSPTSLQLMRLLGPSRCVPPSSHGQQLLSFGQADRQT